MSRPKIMEDMKVVSHALDKSDLIIIEKERGNLTASAYLRYLLRETQKGALEEKNELENKLKKELRDTKAKLEVFERRDRTISQEHKAATQEISEGFIGYLSKYPNAGQRERDNWLCSRCKDSCGVKPIEILSSLPLKGQSTVEFKR